MSGNDKHNLKNLLGRALAGDVCAWNDFFGELRKYLHAQVRKVPQTEGSEPLDYSALVQSTLRRVWERIADQFPGGVEDETLGRFLGWAKTIVQNRARDDLRRQRRQRTGPAGSALERLADPRQLQPCTPRDRIAAATAAALDRLGDVDRKVVELFWFEELSDVEISRRLGCSAGAVRVKRFRALRKLRSPQLQSLMEDCHVGRC
jgi:RNA polymerase sigma factor (sigma-70 family)